MPCFFSCSFLEETVLSQIVASQLPDLPPASPLVAQVIKLFRDIRAELSLEKAPSTAELVSTVALLVDLGFDPSQRVDLTKPEFMIARQQIAAALGKMTGDKSKVAERLAKN